MSQDTPRKDESLDEGLLDFGTEAPNPVLDKEWDVVLNRQERHTASGTQKVDIQPDAHMLALDEPSSQPFVWSDSVHSSAERKIGIALLILGSIGALAWSG